VRGTLAQHGIGAREGAQQLPAVRVGAPVAAHIGVDLVDVDRAHLLRGAGDVLGARLRRKPRVARRSGSHAAAPGRNEEPGQAACGPPRALASTSRPCSPRSGPMLLKLHVLCAPARVSCAHAALVGLAGGAARAPRARPGAHVRDHGVAPPEVDRAAVVDRGVRPRIACPAAAPLSARRAARARRAGGAAAGAPTRKPCRLRRRGPPRAPRWRRTISSARLGTCAPRAGALAARGL